MSLEACTPLGMQVISGLRISTHPSRWCRLRPWPQPTLHPRATLASFGRDDTDSFTFPVPVPAGCCVAQAYLSLLHGESLFCEVVQNVVAHPHSLSACDPVPLHTNQSAFPGPLDCRVRPPSLAPRGSPDPALWFGSLRSAKHSDQASCWVSWPLPPLTQHAIFLSKHESARQAATITVEHAGRRSTRWISYLMDCRTLKSAAGRSSDHQSCGDPPCRDQGQHGSSV